MHAQWLGCVDSLWLHGLTAACQVSLSMEFSRHWSGLPPPTSGDLPDPGIKSTSLVSPALASRFFTTRATCEAYFCFIYYIKIQENIKLPYIMTQKMIHYF